MANNQRESAGGTTTQEPGAGEGPRDLSAPDEARSGASSWGQLRVWWRRKAQHLAQVAEIGFAITFLVAGMSNPDLVIDAILFGFAGFAAIVGILTGVRRSVLFKLVGTVGVICFLATCWIFLRYRQEQLKPPPRLTITDVFPTFISPLDNMRVNVYYKNEGDEDLISGTPGLIIKPALSTLSASQEDELYRNFAADPWGPPGGGSNRLMPGKRVLITLPFNFEQKTPYTVDWFTNLKRNNDILYIMIEFHFIRVSDHSRWVSERCLFWSYNIPPGVDGPSPPIDCIGHNGIFRYTAKGVQYARP